MWLVTTAGYTLVINLMVKKHNYHAIVANAYALLLDWAFLEAAMPRLAVYWSACKTIDIIKPKHFWMWLISEIQHQRVRPQAEGRAGSADE